MHAFTPVLVLLVGCVILAYSRWPSNWQPVQRCSSWLRGNNPFVNGFKAPLSMDQKADIMTKEMIPKAFSPESWQIKSFNWYTTTLLDQKEIFPCIYAAKGYRGREQLFLFINESDISTTTYTDAVAHALRAYLPQSRQLGPNTSLVVLTPMVEPQAAFSVAAYNEQYWHFLKGLNARDNRPWPSDVPEQIDTPRWCFCFNGEPVFTAILTPAHRVRRSRYAPFVCVVFQPKWIFDILFSTPRKRQGATERVRGLLREYDEVAVSPELKDYGDENGREALQYYIMDDNVPSVCPYEKLSV